MNYQFALIDYTANPNGVSTVITEPVGWDGITLRLQRDKDWKGFYDLADDTTAPLQFDGAARDILINAYDANGAAANVQLVFAMQCDGEDTWQTIFQGSFWFPLFKQYTGDRCYVECSVIANIDLMHLRNRQGQKVDMDSLAGFDQLPVNQTSVTTANFSGPNLIRVNQLMNGLQPGSQIVISNVSLNNGTFLVASSKPDYSEVIPDALNNAPVSQTITPTTTFNPSNNTISVNQVVNIPVGTDIVVTSSTISVVGGTICNDGTYKVTACVGYFNYSMLTVTPISFVTSGQTAMEPEMTNACNIQGTFIAGNKPTSTIITVVSTTGNLTPITNEGPVTATVTADYLVNNLTPYNGLGKLITIPGKTIRAVSEWKAPQDSIYNLNMAVLNNPNPLGIGITPDWPDITADIDQTNAGTATPSHNINISDPPDALVQFQLDSLACSGQATLVVNISPGSMLIPEGGCTGGEYSISECKIFAVVDSSYDANAPYNPGDGHMILAQDLTPSNMAFNTTISNINFPPGYQLFIYFRITSTWTTHCWPNLLLTAGSYFQFYIDSTCSDTPCNVYMVNEVLSRCAENYTDGDLVVYSDYFGRTDAQPQPGAADGCGGLECITNGLRIRGCEMPDGSTIPKFTAGLQDTFNALDAIHNIGMGLEPDPVRGGSYKRLRVEPVEWFYQNTILMTCNNIMNFTNETDSSLLPSSIKCGYQQFETWNNNGLYDIFGDRTWRTELRELNNQLDKTCNWMASDYAIEFTRREFGATSADSRYDSSTFILCLTKSYEQQVEFVVGPGFLITGDAFTISGFFPDSSNMTISGTANNNITASVVGATVLPDGLIFVRITPTTMGVADVIPGYESGATLTANGLPVPNPGSVIMLFIDGLGGALLVGEDMFGINIGDQLQFSNTGSNNYTFTVAQLLGNTAATNAIEPSLFPMIIIPSYSPSFTTENAPNCIIKDLTTPLFFVEQGLQNAANILYPDTVMNYRISPAHNALRHFKDAAMAYRNPADANLIFIDGEGNFYAMGNIASGDSCAPENGPLSEGGNLTPANFANTADAAPLYYAEQVKFEYPVTWQQYLTIKANPYGLIGYQSGSGAVAYGWIDDFQLNPVTGMGQFILRPKIA